MPTKRQTRNALPGHRAIEVDDEEYNFIQGVFGPGRKNKKSGLQAFARTGGLGGAKETIFGNTISGEAQRAEHARVADLSQYSPTANIGAGGGSMPINPNIPTPNLSNPLADQGSVTRNFAGPSSQTRLDDPVEKLQNKVMTQAGAIMDRPYEAYLPAQRFEGPSADTDQSFKDVRAMQGTGQKAFTAAGKVGAGVSKYSPEQVKRQNFLGGPAGQTVSDHMSPHTANVVKGMQDSAMDTMQRQRNALQSRHQMAGAGLGSRGAIENAIMSSEVQKNLGRQVSGALEGSYGQAAQTKMGYDKMAQDAARYNQQAGLAAQDVRLRGAGQQVAAAEAGRGAAGQDIDLLGRSGAAQEAYGQRDKDFAYDQWLQGKDWDKENLMLASNVLGAAPSGSTTTSTRPMHQKKDRFGRAIAGAGAGSAFGPWGAAGGAAIGFLS